MARREIVRCDVCDEEWVDGERNQSFSVVYDRVTNSAGSGDDDWVNLDICESCILEEFELVLNKLSNLQRKEWLNSIGIYTEQKDNNINETRNIPDNKYRKQQRVYR